MTFGIYWGISLAILPFVAFTQSTNFGVLDFKSVFCLLTFDARCWTEFTFPSSQFYQLSKPYASYDYQLFEIYCCLSGSHHQVTSYIWQWNPSSKMTRWHLAKVSVCSIGYYKFKYQISYCISITGWFPRFLPLYVYIFPCYITTYNIIYRHLIYCRNSLL